VPAGTVIRAVAQTRERLLGAGVRAGLVVAVESMTRARLERFMNPSVPPTTEPESTHAAGGRSVPSDVQ
jgi:hypothetical protein